MPISVNCPACDRKLKAGDHLAGRQVKCPACQAAIQIPSAAPEPKVPAERPPATTSGDGEFSWDAIDFSNRSQVEDTTKPPPVNPRPKRIQLTDGEDESVMRKPRIRDEVSEDASERPAASKRKSKPPAEREPDALASWRDHLHWLLALALIPLAISLLSDSDVLREEFEKALQDHPELSEATDKASFLQALPQGKLPSAHLAHDSLMHWGYALAATALFLALLAAMFPGGKTSVLGMFWSGLATGTIGIVLLLVFQYIAGATRGVMPRRLGWGVILFFVVKFIGFSYYCASDPDNGFLLSFLGFTCGVGLCEELCKALPVVLYLNATDRPEWRGACLIGLASGVGFGISEGIMYSSDNYNGLAPALIYLVRFLSCVTLHAVWSGSVALLMQRNMDYIDPDWEWEDITWFVIHYLGIAMLLHGLYDTLLKQEQQALALAVAAASFGWWGWRLHRAKAEA